jgi:hypothetical protein|tara:strand:- start:35 stop:316 length:282 start_codon:yes stop_codon:yes gene_type:complete
MAAVAGALRERCGGGAKVLFRRKSPRRPVNAETCAAVLWRDGSVNEEALLMHESITIDSSSDAPPAFRRVVTSTWVWLGRGEPNRKIRYAVND